MKTIMTGCFRGLRSVSASAALFSCLLLACGNGTAATEYAPLMPLAQQSLLLDITSAGERLVAAGERGHILYSDDHGSSWQQARVPTTQMLTGIHFVNAQRGWAVGHDGLVLVSDDGGGSWRVQRDGIAAQHQANIEMRERAHQQMQAIEQALQSTDAQNRAELELQLEDAVMDLEDADLALEEAVFTSPLMDLWFQDEERGWTVGAFGTLLATDNGGQTWRNQAGLIDNPDEFHLNAISGDGKGRVFIAGEGGVMYRSLDGGHNWETLEAFYEGSWVGTLYSASSDTLLLFGLRGNLYRSTDFGQSWQMVENASDKTLAGGATAPSGEIALVGAVGTLLLSDDGGQSFRRSMLPQRLSLSSALYSGGRLVLVGQGGAREYRIGNE
jgi:photosystem II stability/assembly factor-like uncharacterized protein